jgi:heptosyltransferase-2
VNSLLPGRLLVDLPNWVGDLVMALPALDRVIAGNAGGTSVLHCRAPVRRLLADLFPETRIVVSPRRAFPLAAAWRIRRQAGPVTLGITLRNATRSKLLLFLLARRRMGSVGNGGRLLMSASFAVDRRRHQVFDSDPMLLDLDLPAVDPGWRAVLSTALLDEGRRCLEDAGLEGHRVVGLAPTAAWGSSKQWPGARFGELARRLAGCGFESVVLIGPGEQAVAQEVVRAAGAALPVLGADTDIAGLVAVMAHLAALVSNDSGPMHLGAVIGTPVVALFGPTDPCRTAPLGNGHAVLCRNLECAPCLQRTCPLEHNDCLHGLEVAAVADAVTEIVA